MDQGTVAFDEDKVKRNSEGAYSFTISSYIHERLQRHILILKKLVDRSTTKQRWIISAVQEKLTRDASKTLIPKADTLTVKLDEELEASLLKRIEFIKKFRFSFSKKQWLVEAILEKLDKDEAEIEKKALGSQLNRESTHNSEDKAREVSRDSDGIQITLV